MARRVALGGAVVVLLFGACSSAAGPLPPPPDIPPPGSTTTALDFGTVGIRGVPAGRAVTTIPIGPGPSTLSGTVLGPDGPVPEADILVERIVNDGVGSMMIKAGPDGVWSLPGVLGGRYRVRAWRSPDLALIKPAISFVDAGATKTIDLRVSRYGGLAVKAAIAPNPPPVNHSSSLVVLVTTRTVDERGVVRATPVPRVRVELVGSSSWRLESANPAVTDERGEATWLLRCREEGEQTLAVTVGDGDTFPLELPGCAVAPTTTTADEPSPTSSSTTR